MYVQSKEEDNLETYVMGEDGVHKPVTLCVYHHNYTYGKNSALLKICSQQIWLWMPFIDPGILKYTQTPAGHECYR